MNNHLNEENERPREGMFDAQLSFPAPFAEAPLPVARIIKRDGREAPFDKRKIADAIFAAARSIGGNDRDRADHLASAVAIYLGKTLNGAAPTVDQVSDAVEKVLLQMGHAQTAVAFVRYRDKQTRLRKLQNGDVRAILGELDEARRIGMEASGALPCEMLVRTSDDQLAQWDRARIAEALVRETRMDPGLADLIAREVEQHILSAGVKSLTASLVRELVDVRLMEHGLDEFRRRHMRLGVPLYDAEQIICAPNQGDAEWAQDPETTDHVLAERVKREFALTQIFSVDVADAHLAGDLHIHDLGMPDRLDSMSPAVEYVLLWGVLPSGRRGGVRPPSDIETLLTQTGRFNAMLRRHVSGSLQWDGLNIRLAPFLADLDDGLRRQFAKLLLMELAHGGALRGRRSPQAEFVVAWEPPKGLADEEPIGADSLPINQRHADYRPSAQRLANALLDVCRELPPGMCPAPSIAVTETALRAPGFNEFLARAVEMASSSKPVRFQFLRDEAPRQASWQPHDVIAQRIALNLARAAYRVESLDDLWPELDRLAALAVQAHAEKRAFLDSLIARKNSGPLGLFAIEHEGQPFLDKQAISYAVGVAGLNECVQHLTGNELHETEETRALAHRILAYLDDACQQLGHRSHLPVFLSQTADPIVLARFAQHDLHRHPEIARRLLKNDPFTHDLEYTPGAQLRAHAPCTPMERIHMEGAFHDRIPHGAFTPISLPASETSPDAVAGFLTKIFYRSRAQHILFTR